MNPNRTLRAIGIISIVTIAKSRLPSRPLQGDRRLMLESVCQTGLLSQTGVAVEKLFPAKIRKNKIASDALQTTFSVFLDIF
jgi:hypothetical protein